MMMHNQQVEDKELEEFPAIQCLKLEEKKELEKYKKAASHEIKEGNGEGGDEGERRRRDKQGVSYGPKQLRTKE